MSFEQPKFDQPKAEEESQDKRVEEIQDSEKIKKIKEDKKRLKEKEIESKENELFEGLDKDPRIQEIKDELVDNWKKINGSRYKEDDKDCFKAEFIEFVHGDIYSQPDYGKEIITLDDRAIKVFEKRFPEDTEIYAKKEKTRIYENPINDPLIKKTEKKIKRMTDEHMAQLLKGIWGEEKAKEVNRSKEEARFAIRQWDIFISLYPEKTAGYKNKFEPIREILKRRETKVQQAIRSELRYPKTESHHLKGIVEQVKLRKHDEQQDGQRKEKNPELRHFLKGDKGTSIF